MLIAIGPLVPSTVTTLADFIAWCRSNPNHSSYEAGYPTLEHAEWFGFFVPARTPSGTVETRSSVLRTALQTKEVQAGLANQSVDVGGLTPAEFARQIKADTDRWGPIVKASGFTPLD
jgi:tripartite-type tricarboxylate transporter receptor subunit TctC